MVVITEVVMTMAEDIVMVITGIKVTIQIEKNRSYNQNKSYRNNSYKKQSYNRSSYSRSSSSRGGIATRRR